MKNLIKLHDSLISFKQLGKKSFAEEYLDYNEDVIIWCINRRCNFNCKYCQFAIDEPETYFDVDKIAQAFNRDGKKWHIIVTGGEPLLKHDIIDIFEKLSQKHTLFVNTNFSLSYNKLKEFVERVNPKKVGMNIAIHVEEREKIDKDYKDFIKKIELIKSVGVLFFVSYVFYPSLIDRIDDDFAFFKSHGIEKITLKPFYGSYNGISYPKAYNDIEREYLNKYYLPEYDLGDNAPATNFKGNICYAGQRTFYINEHGIARRCENSNDNYGNFFENSFSPDKKPKACNEDASRCPYQCLIYAKKKKASLLSRMLTKI
jgi:MoaA/NifB/PqqE/SkfB family radical SAM enzyme